MKSTFLARVVEVVWRGWKRQLLPVFAAVLVMATLSTSGASAAPIGKQTFEGIGTSGARNIAIDAANANALNLANQAGYPTSSCGRSYGPDVYDNGFGWYTAFVKWTCNVTVPGTVVNTELKAGHTGMCAAVGNNSIQPGMWFIQYKCDGKENKRFDLVPTGTPSQYYLQVRSTGLCMVPEGMSPGAHMQIVQNACQPFAAFRWTLTPQGDGKFTMTNAQSSLCLGVAWGMTNSGQPLDQASCGAHTGQAWTIPGLGSPGGGGGGGGGGGRGGGGSETEVL